MSLLSNSSACCNACVASSLTCHRMLIQPQHAEVHIACLCSQLCIQVLLLLEQPLSVLLVLCQLAIERPASLLRSLSSLALSTQLTLIVLQLLSCCLMLTLQHLHKQRQMCLCMHNPVTTANNAVTSQLNTICTDVLPLSSASESKLL